VRRALSLCLVAAGLVLAGCGDDSSSETTTTSAETDTVRIYLLRDGKVWPVSREIEKTGVFQLDEQLKLGPTDEERKLGFTSEVTGDSDPSRAALAQMVYTSTQFDPTKPVEIDGKTYTRADFEDQTPGILVESPLPFADVSSPIRATGTANTFEATFNYELTDTDGKIVDENFVTATSGTGTRGTFDFTTKKFTVPFSGVGSLVVFERSAEDGSRTKLVEIPLRMSQ
jgi:Immunoglobulin-like domain of bacterial spore germination